ncbi:MAG TPA: hypothetical protein VKM55_05050 [Candidatus Lokiarchaeia archaeon]|nr:hypothetical protein [Candidatus Lokiarchaeia archaeon]
MRDSLMNRPVMKGDYLLLKNMHDLGLVVQETTPGDEIVQITPNAVLEKITEDGRLEEMLEEITAGITEDDVREALTRDFGEDVAKRFTIQRIDKKNSGPGCFLHLFLIYVLHLFLTYLQLFLQFTAKQHFGANIESRSSGHY